MMELKEVTECLREAKNEIGKVIIGQERVVDLALATILCGSHALIEGVPGIAKTLLVRTLGTVMACDSRRIQFTPDLMPSDITGTNVFDLSNNQFNLVKGPVFTTFLLADEINRAPAKTQSALLQCMQERMVTIDGVNHPLSPNFTVFATQNPIEYEGTYPLPEAQKDRFLLKIVMDYPSLEEERTLAEKMLTDQSPERTLADGEIKPVINTEELAGLRRALGEVTVKEELVDYILNIVRRTRGHNAVLVGAGPRATQALLLGVRVNAVLDERNFVIPDDVKEMCGPVLEHRLLLRPEFEIEGLTIPELIRQLLEEVAVPS